MPPWTCGMEYEYNIALKLSTAVLARAPAPDLVQDGCQQLLTRHVIILDVKVSNIQKSKATKGQKWLHRRLQPPPPPRALMQH